MKRRDFMIGSFLSAILAACRRKASFSSELIKPFESNFEFPLVQVPGKYAVEAWEHLTKDDAISPVVIGDPESLLYISEGIEFAEQLEVEATLAKVEKLEFPHGLREAKLAEFKAISESMKDNETFKEMFGDLDSENEFIIESSDILNDWPRGRNSKSKLSIPSVAINWATEKPFETIVIALIPTSDWTTVPAYMRFGGYNDCPASEWHIAALRYWRDLYNVRLIGLSHDTLDLRVTRHPKTREEAAKQAIALYDYCPDLVEQGSGSISELARDLMSNNWWYLWWD